MQQGSVSIIVPTSGNGRFLWDCLDRLGQFAGDFGVREVLVVVNGDFEKMNQARYQAFMAGLETTASKKFRLIHEPVPGLLAGRHRGAMEAKGDYLSFIDDDVLLGPMWISSVRELCESGSLGNRIAGGPIRPDFRGNPPSWLARLWVSSFDSAEILQELSLVVMECQEPVEVSPFLIFGLNFTIRREALFSLGGFHPDLTPPKLLRFRGDGESAIADRLVTMESQAIFHPGLAVRHVIGTERLNTAYLCKVWFRQGVSDEFRAMRKLLSAEVSWPVAGVGIISNLLRKVIRIARMRGLVELAKKTGLLKQLCLAAGRLYLRFQHARDHRVQQWIRKEDYFDYGYPN